MILVMLFVAVLVIEGISIFLKAYLDGRIKRNTTANVIISVCIMVFFVYSLSAVKDVSTSKLGIKVEVRLCTELHIRTGNTCL